MTKALIKTVSIALCFIFLLSFSSCSVNTKTSEKTDFAMGSVITAKLYGKSSDKLEKAQVLKTVKALDGQISKTIADSDVCRINSANGEYEVVNSDTYEYLKTAVSVFSESGGKAAVTSGALTELWGFDTDEFHLPSAEEINNAKGLCSDSKITFGKNNDVCVPNGYKINLGSVGKGIACDEAIQYIRECNNISANEDPAITGAVVSVGGSIATYGKPEKGDRWSVGIRNPFGSENDYFAVLSLGEAFISTSGDYEKTFTGEDGKKYFHILDLTTGYPAESELTSVTIVAPTGLLSDALSTMCFILGKDESLPLLEKYGAEAVFVYKDKTVFATDGIKDSLNITANGFTLI